MARSLLVRVVTMQDRVLRRSVTLFRRAFAKLEKLFVVMASVHHMKFSPLRRGQGAQDGMVKHVDAGTETRFTLRDNGVHLPNLGPELGAYLLHWQAFRHCHRRGFDPGGHVPTSHDDQGFYAVRHGGP